MDRLRVAAYARVSTDADDQVNSYESQVKYFKDYIERQDGWELVKVYSDKGLTGTLTKKRFGFNEMIEDAVSGKIDFIITKEVSRFARNTVDTLQFTRKLKEKDIGIYFMIDNINSLDADAELRLTIMASLAQEESRKTSERVKWGQRRQMEKGVVFGRDMLGYKVQGGKLYLVEQEAEVVRLIFHKYTIEGKGTYIIAEELKAAGIKPYNPDGRMKNTWSNTSILRVLRNEKYVGDLLQKKTFTKNYLDHKKRYNKGEEEMVYIRDHHPEIAIISRDLWDATQKELKRRSLTTEQKSKHSNRYWASGKVICGECGSHFVNKIRTNSTGQQRSWNCGNHVKGISSRDRACSLTETASDRSLKNIVFHIMNMLVEEKESIKTDIIKSIEALQSSMTETTNSTESLEKQITQYEQKKLRLLDIRLEGEISKEDFEIKNTEFDDEIFRLNSKVAEIVAENENRQKQNVKMIEIIDEVDRILALNDYDLENLLGLLTENITVYAGHTVVVRLKDIPFNFRVRYKSTGKGDTYRTEILSLEVM